MLVLFRRTTDGLKDLRYKLVSKINEKLYTNITVEINMPKKLIELEREAAKKEAIKLANEARRKAAKKKSKGKETPSNPKNEIQEDIKVPKVDVKGPSSISKAPSTTTTTTTSSITAESLQHVVNKITRNNSTPNDVNNKTNVEGKMNNSTDGSDNNENKTKTTN